MTVLLAALADRLDAARPEVVLGLLALLLAQVVAVLAIRSRARRDRGNRAPLARPRPMSAPAASPPAPPAAPPTPRVRAREYVPGLAPEDETAAELELAARDAPEDDSTVEGPARRTPPREYMTAPAPRQAAPRQAAPPRPASRSESRPGPSAVAERVVVAPRGPHPGRAVVAGAALAALAAALLLYLTRTRESRG